MAFLFVLYLSRIGFSRCTSRWIRRTCNLFQSPSLETLTDYRPKIPLRIYSDEGLLIGEFGVERRNIITIEKVPKHLKQAILAAEDDRFYEHGGVDYIGVLRAAYSNFTAGSVQQGASTITMQVARNFF